MSKTIAVTGPRKLTVTERNKAKQTLIRLTTESQGWHIGDATGLDELARDVAGKAQASQVETHWKNQQLPYKARGAERSTRMIRALAGTGGTLHAWPNKPAPPTLTPNGRNWPKGAQGSGTWGTIALAVGHGLTVELHPLADLGHLPEWLTVGQPQQTELMLA